MNDQRKSEWDLCDLAMNFRQGKCIGNWSKILSHHIRPSAFSSSPYPPFRRKTSVTYIVVFVWVVVLGCGTGAQVIRSVVGPPWQDLWLSWYAWWWRWRLCSARRPSTTWWEGILDGHSPKWRTTPISTRIGHSALPPTTPATLSVHIVDSLFFSLTFVI